MIVNTIGARVYFSRMYGEKTNTKSKPSTWTDSCFSTETTLCVLYCTMVGWLAGWLTLYVFCVLRAHTHRVSVSLWYVIEIVGIYIIHIHIHREASERANATRHSTHSTPYERYTQSALRSESALEMTGEHAHIKTHAHCQRALQWLIRVCVCALFFGSLRLCVIAVYFAFYCSLLYARALNQRT